MAVKPRISRTEEQKISISKIESTKPKTDVNPRIANTEEVKPEKPRVER